MRSNYELKESARDNLRENWTVAILVWLIAWVLTDAFTGNGGKEGAEFIMKNGAFIRVGDQEGSLASLLAFIIGGPINFGMSVYFLKLARYEEAVFKDLFSGFNYFLKTFVLNLLIIMFTFLWFLLLIIPGIIAILKYSMAYYIMNDNPEISPLEAIRQSKEMMDGNKERLFMLWVSFIGWFLLGIFTFGIGFLYVMPYYNAAKANFYEDIKSINMQII